jgi:hypothetical protein
MHTVRAIVAALALIVMTISTATGQTGRIRWDIVSFFPGMVNSGGIASALANDGSRITVTGSGTFAVAGDGGHPVTGGGTWEIFGADGTSMAGGIYEVTRLVRYDEAVGAAAEGEIDKIDDVGDQRAGLVVFEIAYSDGSQGILVVSCHLQGTPDTVLEGITASKGFVNYWNRVAPVLGMDGNFTVFHVE